MKLSEFKGEDALEIIADLIDPISIVFSDKEFVADYRSGKPKLLLAKNLVKKHKKEVLEVLAILDCSTLEDYKKKSNPIKIVADLVSFFNDEELLPFFNLQSQTKEEN